MTVSLWSLVAGLFVAWTLAMAIVIVQERRSPAATIAWLLVLAFLPIFGWVIYRLIGPLRLERRKLRRRLTRKLVEEATAALWEIEHCAPMHHREQIARVAIAAGEAPPLRASTLELYTEGEAKYRAVAEAIDAARHHVHLEYDTETAEFSGERAWRDTHLRLEGSAVRVLQRVFAEDWFYATGQELASSETYFPTPAAPDGEIVQIVSSGPDFDAFAIHKMFFTAINRAETRVWLTTPYFVPDDAILHTLVSSAMRGVDVRVIAPAQSDSRLVDLAARSYFPDLLAAGARVYEYQPRFIHAKTFVIDDDIAIIGTANLDNRSFRLDFEVAAVIYGAAMNARLSAVFEADLAHCCELDRRAPHPAFWTRLGQSGARLFSPLL